MAEYIDLISKIGQCVDGFVWWGCIISSKNRFYPRFTDILLGNAGPKLGVRSYVLNLASLLKHIAVLFVRLVLTRIFRSSYKEKVLERYRGKGVTLVKTFGYHHTDFSNFQDTIFHDLPGFLRAEGETVLTLYEPVNVFWKSVQQRDPHYASLSYFDFIEFSDLGRVLGALLLSFFRQAQLSPQLAFNGQDISRDFKRLYLFEHWSPATFHSLTYYHMVKNLCRDLEIKKYIYTFENNSWERMSLLAFRGFSPKTRLVGYQHNVVPLASANMFLGRGEEASAPVPDVVLTTGPRPLAILKEHGHFNEVHLHPTAAIRYRYLEGITAVPRRRDSPKLLVALEGVWQAASIMNHLLEKAEQLEGWEVIVRTHQALPYERLKRKIRFSIEHYPHFKLSSQSSLKDDLTAATAVLYWGSSVALEAIKFGKPLINIKLSEEIDFDPLFEMRALKWSWTPPADLRIILSEIQALGEADYTRLNHEASAYLESYFAPVTRENLKPFFN